MQRHKQHIHDIGHNNSQHIPGTGHCYGKIKDTMDRLWINENVRFLDVLEQLYIYINTKNVHLNDIYRDTDSRV
jgi:hypothetical protein